MEQWKKSFVGKLKQAQTRCASRFDEVMSDAVQPAFEQLSEFLQNNGFRTSTPLSEPTRRSFKFELAENAYVLAMYRFSGVSEFELRCETFVPGGEPVLEHSTGSISELGREFATERFQESLDAFIGALDSVSNAESEELVAV